MKDNQEKKQIIYIGLDELLDTRLASLGLIHPTLVIQALENDYHNREEDSFPNMSKKNFKELYDTRDNEVLKISGYCETVPFLQECIQNLLKQALESPFVTEIKLVVNTSPYVLTEDELVTIQNSLRVYCSDLIEIEFINKTDKQLTANYCKQFSVMIRYSYSEWLDNMAKDESIKQTPLTHVTLFVPALYLSRLPTEQERRNFEADKKSAFDYAEIQFSPFISLKYLPVSIFCVKIDMDEKQT